MSIFNFKYVNDVAYRSFETGDLPYPDELVKSSFERQLRYLERLQKYSWAPRIVSVDKDANCVAFTWNDRTCDEYIPETWFEQLEQIVKDLHAEQIHAPSFYKQYFYVDSNEKICFYNLYTAFDYSERPTVNFYRPILNQDREELIDKLAPDGILDVRLLVFHGYNNYIKWPDNGLAKIYKRVYGYSTHPTFCMDPFFHISTNNAGNYRSCCLSEDVVIPKEDGTLYNMRTDSVVQVWNSKWYKKLRMDLLNGVKNPNCECCWKYEASGAFSRRQKNIIESPMLYPDPHPTIKHALLNDGEVPHTPIDFDIKVGTQCNLKCIMCYPGSSSLHQAERDEIEAMGIELPGLLKLQDERVKTFNLKVEEFNPKNLDVDQIVQNLDPGLQHAVQLGLVGGEPLTNKVTQKILEQCVEKDYAKNISLEIITNLSVINPKILHIFEQFKHPMLHVSYDHVDADKFHFIRFPASYSAFETNLNEVLDYNHIITKFSTTWGIFNIFDFEEILTHWEELVNERNKDIFINLGLIYYPNYFNLKYLEPEQKIEIASRIQTFMDNNKHWRIFNNNETLVEAIVKIPEFMEGQQSDHLEVCKERTRVLDLYDSIRGTDYRKLFPYIKRYE